MNGWWIAGIVILVIFVIWVLLRMDWSELSGGDSSFMDKLKAIGDACCLGTIFKRR